MKTLFGTGKSVKILSLIMTAVTLFVFLPVRAFSAKAKAEEKYVSEIRVAYGETVDEAKQFLRDKGYTPIDGDLNAGSADLFSTERAVAAGYKTTSDPDEAITDIRVMNMNSDSVIEKDVREILKEYRNEVQDAVNSMQTSVYAYREAYGYAKSEGKGTWVKVSEPTYKGRYIHDILNYYYEEDTMSLMGDFLLTCELTEFDDEGENLVDGFDNDSLTKIFLQGNGSIVSSIRNTIMQCDDDTGDGSTWISRLDEIGSFANLYDEFSSGNRRLRSDEILESMDERYYAGAMKIAVLLDDFARKVEDIYLSSGVRITDDAEKIEEVFPDSEMEEYTVWSSIGSAYEALKNVEYNVEYIDTDSSGNETMMLSDFLLDVKGDGEDKAEFNFLDDEDDLRLLYPIVASLTETQLATLDYKSLFALIQEGVSDETIWEECYNQFQTKTEEPNGKDKSAGAISVYTGVDRSMFSGTMAVTVDAESLSATKNESYLTGWTREGSALDYLFDNVVYKVCIIALGASCIPGMIGVLKGIEKVRQGITFIESKIPILYTSRKAAFNNAVKSGLLMYEDMAVAEEVLDASVIEGEAAANAGNKAAQNSLNKLYQFRTWGKSPIFGSGFKFAFRVVMVAALIAMTVMTIIGLKKYYNQEVTREIPKYVIDSNRKRETGQMFTYYTAVECFSGEKGQESYVSKYKDMVKNFADLNGYVGKQWLAMYTTKSKEAGDPILASSLRIAHGKNGYYSVDGDTPVCMFCLDTAQNLTSQNFCYNDSTGFKLFFIEINYTQGTFMFFKGDSDAYTLTGSVFSNGTLAIFIGFALVSLAGGFFAGRAVKRKKTPAEAV